MYHIKNAHLTDCKASVREDILIAEGRIRKIGKERIAAFLADCGQEPLVIEAEGRTLLPSFADLHFHMRYPGQPQKETLESGSKAAIRGGYTHLIAMANTKPVVDSRELVEQVQRESAALDLCRLYQVSAVTKGLLGKESVDFAENRKATRFFSDDGRNIDDAKIMEEALRASAELDFIILDHSEEETEMVIRNIEIAKKTRGNLHLCHISRKGSMEAIIAAKKAGYSNITVEVSPHHIYASGLDYRVNPPIAGEEDRLFLIEAIREGYVDAIATDHAPHTAEDKENGAPGISGIESSFSIVHKVFREQGLDMQTLSLLMSARPMAFLREEEHLIREGAVADLVLIEEGEFEICSGDFLSKGKNTPFDGDKIFAKVVMTMKEGRVLYDERR